MKCRSVEFLQLGSDILKKGSYVRFRARGWSMDPFIKDGDIICVEPAKFSAITLGDIVFYRIPDEGIVAHRVIRKVSRNNKIFFLTRGDSVLHIDEYVPAENVLGKVLSIERNGQMIRLDVCLNKLKSIIYARFRILMKIPILLSKILSLFDPHVFVKKTDDSLRSVADKYNSLEEVEFHSQLISDGLEGWEEELVKEFKQPPAKILNVGCGVGREAIALSKIGFEVTGIDISSNMIVKAKEIAEKEGLKINFEAQSVTDIDYPPQYFDYVLFSRGIYSYIPSKKLRIKMLKKIRNILKLDGIFVFSAYYKDIRLFSRLSIMSFSRRIRNYFFKKRFDSEPGDIMVRYVSPASRPEKLCFCHFFSSPKEILNEVRAAGFTILEGNNGGRWILKP